MSDTAHQFLLTRLMRGVTRRCTGWRKNITISTHTPHARRDAIDESGDEQQQAFLLTRLMRGVTKAEK